MAIDWQAIFTLLAFAFVALGIFVQCSSATHDRSEQSFFAIALDFLK